jgi:periplasmic divalent cation tolerance protein
MIMKEKAMSQILVYITAPGLNEARNIADHLVENRLCACVNILPGMASVYRWQGDVCHAEEVAMIAKTTQDRLESLVSAVKSLHPYECPCVVSWPITGGFLPFLQWIQEETRDRVL